MLPPAFGAHPSSVTPAAAHPPSVIPAGAQRRAGISEPASAPAVLIAHRIANGASGVPDQVRVDTGQDTEEGLRPAGTSPSATPSKRVGEQRRNRFRSYARQAQTRLSSPPEPTLLLSSRPQPTLLLSSRPEPTLLLSSRPERSGEPGSRSRPQAPDLENLRTTPPVGKLLPPSSSPSSAARSAAALNDGCRVRAARGRPPF